MALSLRIGLHGATRKPVATIGSTKPATPATNGMVERVNGTIKDATIKATTYANTGDMKADLALFLLFYNFNRGTRQLKKRIKSKDTL